MTQDIHELVKRKYGKLIQSRKSCCGSSSGGCCGDSSSKATEMVTGGLYTEQELEGIPQDLLQTSLGCGNPIALTELHAGEVVLDLGSGAGLDVLLSANRVGPTGKAYGLDMTDEMLAAARANQARTTITNAEFLKGHIEAMPLTDNAVDVIISNCVINLSPDKQRVFSEAYRTLRPGGRIAVSDILVTRELPAKVKDSLLAWAGCVAGALTEEEYTAKLRVAGFENVSVEITRVYDFEAQVSLLPGLSKQEAAALKGALVSAFIRAKKPAAKLTGVAIRSASEKNYTEAAALISRNGLDTDGILPAMDGFMVAECKEKVVGTIGVECYEQSGLLRSFAVDHSVQKAGIGGAMLAEAIRHSQEQGIKTLYLLTLTAPKYFERKGFQNIDRSEIPAILLESSALNHICPVSANCLALHLK